MINTYDPNSQEKIFYFLTRLYNTINNKNINLKALDNLINEIMKYKETRKNSYLRSLLYPEFEKGCKIPSPLPIPTCSFQLHNSINLTTNELGCLVLLYNPFFLYSNDLLNKVVLMHNETEYKLQYASSLYFSNDEDLDGKEVSSIKWQLLNIGQNIPNLYNQYRLVSSSIIIKYIGRMDITSGVIGGAIIFEDAMYPGTVVKADNDNQLYHFGPSSVHSYGNFDLAIDSYYHQETNCVNGLRMVYFPVDNSYEEYSKFKNKLNDLGSTEYQSPLNFDIPRVSSEIKSFESHKYNKFQQMVYVLGAPPNSECLKMDLYMNFEALPNASYLNYMPISPNNSTLSNEEKKNTIHVTQQNAITTANASSIMNVPKESNIFSELNTDNGNLISANLLNMNQ